jgi:hypothetical protein
MGAVCSVCGSIYDGTAAEAESKGSWRNMQRGLVCQSCLSLHDIQFYAKRTVPVDHMATREQLALHVEQLVAELVTAKKSICDAEDALESLGRPKGEYIAKGIEALASQLAELRIVNEQLNATLDVIREVIQT